MPGPEDQHEQAEITAENQAEVQEAFAETHEQVREALHAIIVDEIEEVEKKEKLLRGAGLVSAAAGTVLGFVSMQLTAGASSALALTLAPGSLGVGVLGMGAFEGAAKEQAMKAAYLRGEASIEHENTVEYLHTQRHMEALEQLKEDAKSEMKELKEGGTIRKLVQKCLPAVVSERVLPAVAAETPEGAERVTELEKSLAQNDEKLWAADSKRDELVQELHTEVGGEPIPEDRIPAAHVLYERAIREQVEQMDFVQKQYQEIDKDYEPKRPGPTSYLAAGLIVGTAAVSAIHRSR